MRSYQTYVAYAAHSHALLLPFTAYLFWRRDHRTLSKWIVGCRMRLTRRCADLPHQRARFAGTGLLLKQAETAIVEQSPQAGVAGAEFDVTCQL